MSGVVRALPFSAQSSARVGVGHGGAAEQQQSLSRAPSIASTAAFDALPYDGKDRNRDEEGGAIFDANAIGDREESPSSSSPSSPPSKRPPQRMNDGGGVSYHSFGGPAPAGGAKRGGEGVEVVTGRGGVLAPPSLSTIARNLRGRGRGKAREEGGREDRGGEGVQQRTAPRILAQERAEEGEVPDGSSVHFAHDRRRSSSHDHYSLDTAGEGRQSPADDAFTNDLLLFGRGGDGAAGRSRGVNTSSFKDSVLGTQRLRDLAKTHLTCPHQLASVERVSNDIRQGIPTRESSPSRVASSREGCQLGPGLCPYRHLPPETMAMLKKPLVPNARTQTRWFWRENSLGLASADDPCQWRSFCSEWEAALEDAFAKKVAEDKARDEARATRALLKTFALQRQAPPAAEGRDGAFSISRGIATTASSPLNSNGITPLSPCPPSPPPARGGLFGSGNGASSSVSRSDFGGRDGGASMASTAAYVPTRRSSPARNFLPRHGPPSHGGQPLVSSPALLSPPERPLSSAARHHRHHQQYRHDGVGRDEGEEGGDDQHRRWRINSFGRRTLISDPTRATGFPTAALPSNVHVSIDGASAATHLHHGAERHHRFAAGVVVPDESGLPSALSASVGALTWSERRRQQQQQHQQRGLIATPPPPASTSGAYSSRSERPNNESSGDYMSCDDASVRPPSILDIVAPPFHFVLRGTCVDLDRMVAFSSADNGNRRPIRRVTFTASPQWLLVPAFSSSVLASPSPQQESIVCDIASSAQLELFYASGLRSALVMEVNGQMAHVDLDAMRVKVIPKMAKSLLLGPKSAPPSAAVAVLGQTMRCEGGIVGGEALLLDGIVDDDGFSVGGDGDGSDGDGSDGDEEAAARRELFAESSHLLEASSRLLTGGASPTSPTLPSSGDSPTALDGAQPPSEMKKMRATPAAGGGGQAAGPYARALRGDGSAAGGLPPHLRSAMMLVRQPVTIVETPPFTGPSDVYGVASLTQTMSFMASNGTVLHASRGAGVSGGRVVRPDSSPLSAITNPAVIDWVDDFVFSLAPSLSARGECAASSGALACAEARVDPSHVRAFAHGCPVGGSASLCFICVNAVDEERSLLTFSGNHLQLAEGALSESRLLQLLSTAGSMATSGIGASGLLATSSPLSRLLSHLHLYPAARPAAARAALHRLLYTHTGDHQSLQQGTPSTSTSVSNSKKKADASSGSGSGDGEGGALLSPPPSSSPPHHSHHPLPPLLSIAEISWRRRQQIARKALGFWEGSACVSLQQRSLTSSSSAAGGGEANLLNRQFGVPNPFSLLSLTPTTNVVLHNVHVGSAEGQWVLSQFDNPEELDVPIVTKSEDGSNCGGGTNHIINVASRRMGASSPLPPSSALSSATNIRIQRVQSSILYDRYLRGRNECFSDAFRLQARDSEGFLLPAVGGYGWGDDDDDDDGEFRSRPITTTTTASSGVGANGRRSISSFSSRPSSATVGSAGARRGGSSAAAQLVRSKSSLSYGIGGLSQHEPPSASGGRRPSQQQKSVLSPTRRLVGGASSNVCPPSPPLRRSDEGFPRHVSSDDLALHMRERIAFVAFTGPPSSSLLGGILEGTVDRVEMCTSSRLAMRAASEASIVGGGGDSTGAGGGRTDHLRRVAATEHRRRRRAERRRRRNGANAASVEGDGADGGRAATSQQQQHGSPPTSPKRSVMVLSVSSPSSSHRPSVSTRSMVAPAPIRGGGAASPRLSASSVLAKSRGPSSSVSFGGGGGLGGGLDYHVAAGIAAAAATARAAARKRSSLSSPARRRPHWRWSLCCATLTCQTMTTLVVVTCTVAVVVVPAIGSAKEKMIRRRGLANMGRQEQQRRTRRRRTPLCGSREGC